MANRICSPRNAGRSLIVSAILIGAATLLVVLLLSSPPVQDAIFDQIERDTTISVCPDLKSDSYNGTLNGERVIIYDRAWQCPDEDPKYETSIELMSARGDRLIGVDKDSDGHIDRISWCGWIGNYEGCGEYRWTQDGWLWSSDDGKIPALLTHEIVVAQRMIFTALVEVKRPEYRVASLIHDWSSHDLQ